MSIDLMAPRYKVIADYPDNPFSVNDILVEIDLGAKFNNYYQKGRFGFPNSPSICRPDKWPLNFQKIEWWQERKPEEMPEYVKYIKEYNHHELNSIHKVIKYQPDHGGVAVEKEFMFTYTGNYIPATKEEYDQYIKTVKP